MTPRARTRRAGFSTGEIVEEMDDLNIATAQRDVRHLIANGLITKREIPRKYRGFKPTEETRILIAMMLRKGAKAHEIGEAVGCSAQTLNRFLMLTDDDNIQRARVENPAPARVEERINSYDEVEARALRELGRSLKEISNGNRLWMMENGWDIKLHRKQT